MLVQIRHLTQVLAFLRKYGEYWLHALCREGNCKQKFMPTKTENAAETNAFSAVGNALESAAEKFEEGSTVARQSVAQAAKVTRNFLADGVYKSAYWTSYGLVFSGVYLVALFPEASSFRRGLEEGATHAKTKVHEGKKKESGSPTPSAPPEKKRSIRKRRPAKQAGVADAAWGSTAAKYPLWRTCFC
jgi:hypothetical protein